MSKYNSKKAAQEYISFLDSPQGKVQQEILSAAILKQLPENPDIKLLDAGCGNGWLLSEITKKYPGAEGIEISPMLIEDARKKYPKTKITLGDFTQPLPHPNKSFDYVIFNMSLTDTENPKQVLQNFSGILKEKGKVIVTINNPYYAYPVAVWKHGLLSKIFKKKPALKIVNSYNKKVENTFTWGKENNIESNFHSLENYINAGIKNNFKLVNFVEIKNLHNSEDFDLNFQLENFPLLLLLVFEKI